MRMESAPTFEDSITACGQEFRGGVAKFGAPLPPRLAAEGAGAAEDDDDISAEEDYGIAP